jgi:hypothetical protein
MGFTIEYDGHRYRIIAPNGQKGRWSNYDELASIMIDGKLWIAFSDYFDTDQLLPINKVVPVGETTMSTKVKCND